MGNISILGDWANPQEELEQVIEKLAGMPKEKKKGGTL